MAFTLSRMSTREKYAVFAAGIVVSLFIIFQFMVFPTLNNRAKLRKKLDSKMISLERMVTLKAEYDELKSDSKHFIKKYGGRKKSGSLFKLLDRLAGNADLKENIASMKPSSSTSKEGNYKISRVEIELKAVTMEQLAKYLYMVETSKEMMAYIKRISISQKGKQAGVINVILQVETIKVL